MTEASNNGAIDKTVDVGLRQVAQVYAKGLIAATEQSGQTASVLEELDSFVVDVLDKLPDFADVLNSGMISGEQKSQVLDKALSGKASVTFLNFLKILADRGRLGALRAIRGAACEIYDEMQRRIRVHVTTAVPLDDGQTEQLANSLAGRMGFQPMIERGVDPALIGGLVLRVGDIVYDGSVARQLAQVRTQMIDRSIHEIQSGRDRFRNSD